MVISLPRKQNQCLRAIRPMQNAKNPKLKLGQFSICKPSPTAPIKCLKWNKLLISIERHKYERYENLQVWLSSRVRKSRLRSLFPFHSQTLIETTCAWLPVSACSLFHTDDAFIEHFFHQSCWLLRVISGKLADSALPELADGQVINLKNAVETIIGTRALRPDNAV